MLKSVEGVYRNGQIELLETPDDVDGTLGYADSRDVVNHVSGYVTWLPAEGDVIQGRRENLAADRENPSALLHSLIETVPDLAQGGEDQVAQAVVRRRPVPGRSPSLSPRGSGKRSGRSQARP